ncbi:uncharacterized protein LOC110841623 isoform X3 [Folsomia candida]|uniref:uncharacterized protein LOC110841623 isoform X3 n=1 Tax=Folsomia candida TaxID=158441 RepID=UPI001604F1FF|nr:uncharacterized protein LOC110841623 isoform X3 [Folsomia candida]
METSGVIDKDCPFGALFQQIINEMKNCAPLWEDLTARSTKLHSCLRATLQAISSFLDTLQKIADAATATKGATKDIGTALTRICLRHKALEAKMKTFTSSLMDCLVLPLQDKMEDWKKSTVQLDKDHAKEYKRARTELKKRSIETIRLQKKLRKGSSHNGGSFTGTLPRSGGSNGSDTGSLHGGNQLNRILEVALRDNADKRQAFEDAEKVAIRNALLEERSRFALFVSYLKPVVDEEVGMLFELTHVQEAMQMLEKHSADPFTLPPASEQVIADLKGSCDSGAWSFQTPPSSPSSLGSRKSSMCSISSANSSSSGSAHSPSHKAHNRTIHHPPVMIPGQVGTLRYSSVSSQDSGFTSQDTLFSRYTSFFPQHNKPGNQSEGSNTSSTASSNSSTPSSPYPPGNTALTTWPNLEDSMQFERAACAIMNERPHTISSAYERGHQRPPLTVYTFQPPNPNDANHQESPSTPVVTPVILDSQSHSLGGGIYQSASEIYGILRGKSIDAKPPVPKRCSSLERPQSAAGGGQIPKPLPKNSKSKEAKKQQQRQEEKDNINKIYASNVPDFNQSAEDMIVPQPMYVNMHDLTQMAKEKRQRQEMDLPPPPPELMANKVDGGGRNGDGGLSSGYGSQVGGQFEDTMHLKQQQTPVYGYTGGQEGCPPGRQPTLASSASATSSGTGSRRNSCGAQEKPAPPIRRNSVISASPSRNSPVPMMPHNSSPIMNNYQQQQQPSLTISKQQQQPIPMQTQNPNAPGYPIYIHNPTYNGSSQSSNSHSLSGSQGSSMDSGETTPHASMESLPPPPPAYLNAEKKPHGQSGPIPAGVDDTKRTLSVAETIKNLTDKNHHPVSPHSPHMIRRAQSMRQAGEESSKEKEVRSTPNSRRGSCNNVDSTTISLNNKSRSNTMMMQTTALNQKLVNNHPYGSSTVASVQSTPNNNYVQSQPIYQQLTTHQQQHQQYSQQSQPIYSQVYQQSLASQPIYQQLHYQGSDGSITISQSNGGTPKPPRRFSEELLKTTATLVKNSVLGSKITSSAPLVTSKDIFVQTLSAKLSQMRQGPQTDRKNSYPFTHASSTPSSSSSPSHVGAHQPPPNPKPTSFASKLVASVSSHQKGNSFGEISRAIRVRQWISSKTVPDPNSCRDSLMDQIRRGTKLKPTRTVNDRSAPKIYH